MNKYKLTLLILLVLVCAVFVLGQTNVINLQDIIKVKIVAPLESNGAVPINIQDQHSPALDLYFSQFISDLTLQENVTVGDYDINLTTGHGVVAGNQIEFIDNVNGRGFLVEAVTSGVNIVTVDRPIPNNVSYLNGEGSSSTRELNVDGSGTPQIFTISPPLDVEIDITRVMFQMITDSAPSFDTFGDLTGLTNGIILRIVNGRINNLWNVKTNGEMVNLMYDVSFYSATNPGQGVYGLGGRLTYGGQNKHGVTLRIAQGESIQVIVQDDLTDLVSFEMIGAGHVVTD